MKPFFTKRLFGYIIDLIIIMLLTSLVTAFIPTSEKAKGLTNNLNDMANEITEKETNIKTLSTEINKINYELSRETVINSLVIIVIYILYFVVYPVYNNGQTIGKKLSKLKIITNTGDKLSINNMLFREFILHSIAFNLLTTLVVMVLNNEQFLICSNILSIIQMIMFAAIIFMVVIRKDGRGLHDIVGNTIVVNEEEEK